MSIFERDLNLILKDIIIDSVSIYTNEFDLYMFRLFFPSISSTIGTVPESIGFWESEIQNLNNHKYHIVRDYEQSETEDIVSENIESIKKYNTFTLIKMKDLEI